jgi:transposase, IS30 family
VSGGRKQAPRPVRAGFWERVRSGLSPRDAGVAMGMGEGAGRWFALAGGVQGSGPGPVPGRYLSVADRAEIAIGLAWGESCRVFGARLDPPRPVCTISREVRRDGPRGRYRALRAQALVEERARRPKTARLAGNAELRDWVRLHLEMKWPPEQISARLAAESADRPQMRVSPETICQSLASGRPRRRTGRCPGTGKAAC